MEPTLTTGDPVNQPHHYTRFVIEPIEFIIRNKLEFWAGNVIKYVLRHDAKDGLQDLKKARRYLDAKIREMEGEPKLFPRDAELPATLGNTGGNLIGK